MEFLSIVAIAADMGLFQRAFGSLDPGIQYTLQGCSQNESISLSLSFHSFFLKNNRPENSSRPVPVQVLDQLLIDKFRVFKLVSSEYWKTVRQNPPNV